MKSRIVLILFILVFTISKRTVGQDVDFTIPKSFLIVLSTTDFQTASAFANQVSEQLEFPMDSTNYLPHDTLGFISLDTCSCGVNHGYIARGRWDDGKYVSIEWSNDYNTFKDGLYVVIVASGTKDTVQPILEKVRQVVPSAYIKEAEVYIGCMH